MNKTPKLLLIISCLIFLYSIKSFATDKVIVVTELAPPYQTIKDNIIGGSATEKVEQYLISKGVNYEIQMYPWARAYKLATTKPNIMIYGIANTKKRKDLFDWLIPVYHFKPHLVGLKHRKDLKISNLEQAKIFTIAVQRNDFTHNYLLSKGFEENKNIILTNSIVDSWRLVRNGKVDFLIEDMLYEPIIDGKAISINKYSQYFSLTDLYATTYLAASKSMSIEVKKQLGLTTDL